MYYWRVSSLQAQKQHYQQIYFFLHGETERVSGIPKTTLLVSKRVRILTQ